MVATVSGVFSGFRKGAVDLDPSETATARSSRDYLYDQLRFLARTDPLFPTVTGDFIHYGSFARKTKIRPLDDVDAMMIIHGGGGYEQISPLEPYTYRVWVQDATAPLAPFADSSGYVNSISVLNRIKNSLAAVGNYRKADIKRNMQAVVLDLVSYCWSFDIVPAGAVADGFGGIAHYVIPDGAGNWIRTDPRRDQDYVRWANSRHSGLLLPTMRLLKYWNRRTHKPRLASYYFETLVLKVFELAPPIATLRQAICHFFQQAPLYLAAVCPDPKNLGPAVDANVDYYTKSRVSTAMTEAAVHAGCAMMYEAISDDSAAIYCWERVFGPEFRTYG